MHSNHWTRCENIKRGSSHLFVNAMQMELKLKNLNLSVAFLNLSKPGYLSILFSFLWTFYDRSIISFSWKPSYLFSKLYSTVVKFYQLSKRRCCNDLAELLVDQGDFAWCGYSFMIISEDYAFLFPDNFFFSFLKLKLWSDFFSICSLILA